MSLIIRMYDNRKQPVIASNGRVTLHGMARNKIDCTVKMAIVVQDPIRSSPVLDQG